MSRFRAVVLLAASAAVAPLVAAGGPSAFVAQLASPAPVLSPADQMKTFALEPGYRVELVASEPLVMDPILIEWDADGRMWVVEMPSYMKDISGSDEHAPDGRIVVLEDTNDDGRMDRRTVFADGLVLPRALKVLDRGVLVGEPPNLWLMHDRNGDLRADDRVLVTDTYGRRDANVEHNANGLMWALDNWIYTSEVDMFLRFRRDGFEVRKTLSRGQWGVSQDDAGRIYRNTNSSVLHVDLVPTQYFARTPGLLRTRGSYESLATPANALNETWPVRPTPGVNRGYQFGVLRSDLTLASFTGAAAPTVFRGDRLPADVYGNVFVAEPAGNFVSRIVVRADETGVTATKPNPGTEFFTSTDERFRPVHLSSAPDGTLYVVDMYRGIIQHRGYITEYLRDQILARGLEQPIGLGRIYRVVHETTRRGPRPALSGAAGAELVRTLSHPNGWWRDTAQRLLVERGDASVVPALEALASAAPAPRTRLHALWALDGLDRLSREGVTRALADRSSDVRMSAVRLAERWLRDGDAEVTTALAARVDDPSPSVRRQIAASLGEVPSGPREELVATMVGRYGDDPVVMDAALSGMAGGGPALLAALLARTDETVLRRAALTMVAATITRAGQRDALGPLFTEVAAPSRPLWQRDALVSGLEVALLNVPVPGTAPRRGGPPPEAPCNTCPGGRAGPGGAPAFPTAPASAAGTGRGNAGPRVTLAERPALADVAAGGTPLGARVTRVLERVDWPGKAGVEAVVPLTAAELARFEAGKVVYENLCQACHQPDGRGMDKVAATLIGSTLVLGPPDITARVLLNGVEGPVGLMPPLGATLTDEQIAASLTYIRRAWGQTASPVDPSLVARVRTVTATRTRPWTAAELASLAPGN